MEYPLAASVKPGWDLAAEFVNPTSGRAADSSRPAPPSSRSTTRTAARLETMRAMTQYMDPDYLTYDATAIQQVYEAGEVAIMNEWGSLAGAVLDAEGAVDGVVSEHRRCRRPDHRRRHRPGGRALVGWLHHRQEHLGRRCRGVVPRHGARPSALT